MWKKKQIEKLINRIEKIRDFMRIAGKSFLAQNKIQNHYRDSAVNFIHYLALRTFDLQKIHRDLLQLGVSSFRCTEGFTLANIERVLDVLYLMTGKSGRKQSRKSAALSDPHEWVYKNSTRLFGESEKNKAGRIMVTMPDDAAENSGLIEKLLIGGMNIARVNTAQGDTGIWKEIIKNIKRATDKTGRRCSIYMDLTGPRLRTGKVKKQMIRKKDKEKKVDYILLKKKDTLLLYKKSIVGENAIYDKNNLLLEPAKLSVTLPEIFRDIKKGHVIWFDDGKIGGRVKKIRKEYIIVEIFHAAVKGSKLRSGKGLNLPDTHLSLPSLTSSDLKILPFLTAHADLLGYSFIRKPEDIRRLQKELKRLGREDIGLVLKIENKEAFNALPDLILQGMKSPAIGVMIARGDLAVEVGWQRIAEVQEQILLWCEAAHIPVIWATQVLEKLAKKGIPTRAEMTDVAMSSRAQCVMLNKGPYIVEAARTLESILRRMNHHSGKEKNMLRKLKIARQFFK